MLLGEEAVADQRHWGALLLLAELDREGVHRDRAEDAAARAVHQHLRPGEPAAKAVPVADRDEADPRLPLGDEAASIAGAATASQHLRLGDVAPPGENRLQAVLLRIASERGEPVERDAAADGVEARVVDGERGRAVGDMTGRAGKALGDGSECVELRANEVAVRLVRGREVAHDANDAGRVDSGRLLGRHPEPAHAGVHLHVDGEPFGNARRGDRHLEPGVARGSFVCLGKRAEDEDAGIRELAT